MPNVLPSKSFVLLVEDHDVLREATLQFLEMAGFDVQGVASAEELDTVPLKALPDAYVVDLNLPGEDGLSLAKRLRQANPTVPIIITTARTLVQDRILGYETGADVYLNKPVNPDELKAVLNSLLARRFETVDLSTALKLDTLKQSLQGPNGQCVLTLPEIRLLKAMAAATNHTLDRLQVGTQLSPHAPVMSVDNLQNRLSQLRRKMQVCYQSPEELIKSVRGVGYKLCVKLVALN
jgi:DNA-binding response OmpR family regulator